MTNFKYRPIKYSVNRSVVGKLPENATTRDWGRFNGKFERVESTAHGLAVNVWRGYSFAPIYKNNWRKGENFECAYHIALDFDTMDQHSALETLENEPYSIYASFIYSTPSSTSDAPRSRLVFVLEKPITCKDRYEKLCQALLLQYPYADMSAKDAARSFFGSPKCELIPIWSILDERTVNNIIGLYELIEAEKKAERDKLREYTISVSPNEASTELLERIFGKLADKIINAANGGRNNTVNTIAYTMGGYVSGGYISESDAENMLINAASRMHSAISEKEALSAIRSGLRDGQLKPITIQTRYRAENGRREVTPI